jgi:hypothetical protein
VKFLGINWGDLKLRVHDYTVTHLGVSCTEVVLTGFKMCVCVYVCGCFDNMSLCLLCFVLFVLCFLLFLLCIFILICIVCTSVRTTATE